MLVCLRDRDRQTDRQTDKQADRLFVGWLLNVSATC